MNNTISELVLQASELAELAQGNVVMRARSAAATGRDAVQGLVLAPVAPTYAWEVLEQWERMHEALPALRFRVAQESTAANGDRQALIASEVSVGLMTMRYTVRAFFRRSELKQWWSLVPADEVRSLQRDYPSLPTQSRLLRAVEGSLTIYAHEAGSLILHQNHLVPHPTIPRALEALLSRQMVRDFLAALRRDFVASAASSATGALDVSAVPAAVLQPQ